MTVQLDDARIRITIDKGDAEKQLAELEAARTKAGGGGGGGSGAGKDDLSKDDRKHLKEVAEATRKAKRDGKAVQAVFLGAAGSAGQELLGPGFSAGTAALAFGRKALPVATAVGVAEIGRQLLQNTEFLRVLSREIFGTKQISYEELKQLPFWERQLEELKGTLDDTLRDLGSLVEGAKSLIGDPIKSRFDAAGAVTDLLSHGLLTGTVPSTEFLKRFYNASVLWNEAQAKLARHAKHETQRMMGDTIGRSARRALWR